MGLRWPSSMDVALAVAFGVVAEVELRTYDLPIVPGDVSVPVDSLLVLVPLIPLAWRRAAPFAAVVAMPVLTSAVGLAGGTVCFFSTMLPFVLLMYASATWSRSPRHVAALAAVVLLLAPMAAYSEDFGPDDWVFGTVVAIAAWIAGQGTRRWRHQSQQLAAALASAEAGRDAQAALAVADERARIAREVHDVVAHSVSVMVLQAGVARLDLAEDPAATDAALARIEGTGRTALLEMRRLLGILRQDQSQALAPQPRLAGLPDLVADFERAGLHVNQTVTGDPRDLPDALDLSAYRIVQEALTNALRHGLDATARLCLDWRAQALAIEVSNPVSTQRPPAGGEGHGLVGIGERAALFHGRFRTQVLGGRHVVKVLLPYDGVSP